MNRSTRPFTIAPVKGSVRNLCVVFGDQLDHRAAAIEQLDDRRDAVLMMEVAGESRAPHVPSHVRRTVLFLSAMRHFAKQLAERGRRVRYVTLADPANTHAFGPEIARHVAELRPAQVTCTQPGEWRVLGMLRDACETLGVPLTVLPDEHFICSTERFAKWADGRSSLVMEYFYREQRRHTGYLMDGEQPLGGVWNLDKENRRSFSASGPDPRPPAPIRFPIDDITRLTIEDVRRHIPETPGELGDFDLPVTRADALRALDDFVRHRLGGFGPFEDAMWSREPTLYHSMLSAPLNLKLLNPRECCEAALAAFADPAARIPLQSIEGFIRQIIGWREFIRGIYWFEGPEYGRRNTLGHTAPLPEFFWTGKTDLNCLRQCLTQVVDSAYGHHIQRLMVIGNFALSAGLHPRAVADWFLGMYIDGVDWATTPNVVGMSQHADRRPGMKRGDTGLVGTKPYIAGANYISKMSDYCRSCRYDPKSRLDRASAAGKPACPLNTFYWDFLLRHTDTLTGNQRMAIMLKAAQGIPTSEKVQIRIHADALRSRLGMARGATPTQT